MWILTVLFMMAFSPLLAADLEEWRRSEDWEVALTRALALTREQRFEEANALYGNLQAAADTFQFPLQMKAKCLNNHGSLLLASGHVADAEVKFQAAAAFWARSTGEETDEHATTLGNLGEVYRRTGRYAQAETSFRQSLAIREAIARREPLRMATTHSNLGDVQRLQRRFADAEASFQKALQLRQQALGPKHHDVAVSLNNLAVLRQDQGDIAAAEQLYREAIALHEEHTPVDKPALTGALNNLAELLLAAQRPADAEPLLRRSIAIEESPATIDQLGVLFLRQGKATGAEALFRRALALRGRESLPALQAMHHLSQSLVVQKRFTEAERFLTEELALIERHHLRHSEQHGYVLAELAYVQLAQRRYADGERSLNEVNGFAAQLPASQQERVAGLYKAYAYLLRSDKQNRTRSALAR